jgi:hypothetical protein
VTTTQNNDLMVFISAASWDFNLVNPLAKLISASSSFIGTSVGYAGQEGTGASITPTFTGSGGSGVINLATLAIKANTPTAALFVGVGAESFNSAAASSVSPTIPTNAGLNDTLIAAVCQQGASIGNAITVAVFNGTYAGSGVTYGATTLINTDAHTAVTFNGTTGDVTSTMPAALSQVSQTLEVWFKFSGTPNGALIKTGDTNTGWGVGIGNTTWDNAGVHLLGLRSNIAWVTFSGIPNLVAGTTYHVVVINNGTSFKAWLNNTSYTGSSNGANTPINKIGVGVEDTAGANPRYLAATEQKAAFYNYELSATQIANHYLAGTTAPSGYAGAGVTGGTTYDEVIQNDGPVVYYNLGESSGTTATNLGSLSIPWTQIGPVLSDPSGVVNLSLFTATAISGHGAAQFNFASNPSTSDGLIVAFGNLDPATPVDASATLSAAGMDSPMASSITPTPFDELIAWFITPAVGIGTAIFTAGGAVSRIGAGYFSLSKIGTQQSGGTNNNPFAAITMGLRAKPR